MWLYALGLTSFVWHKIFPLSTQRQQWRKIFPLDLKAMYPLNTPMCAIPSPSVMNNGIPCHVSMLLIQLGNTRQQQWLCFFNLSNKLSDGLYNGYLTLDHDNLLCLQMQLSRVAT